MLVHDTVPMATEFDSTLPMDLSGPLPADVSNMLFQEKAAMELMEKSAATAATEPKESEVRGCSVVLACQYASWVYEGHLLCYSSC